MEIKILIKKKTKFLFKYTNQYAKSLVRCLILQASDHCFFLYTIYLVNIYLTYASLNPSLITQISSGTVKTSEKNYRCHCYKTGHDCIILAPS